MNSRLLIALVVFIASAQARLIPFLLPSSARISPNKQLIDKYSSIFRETAHQLTLSQSNTKLAQGNLENIRNIITIMVNFVIAFNTFDVVYSLVGSNIDASAMITPQLPIGSD